MKRLQKTLVGGAVAAFAFAFAVRAADDAPLALLPANSGDAFRLSGSAADSAKLSTAAVTSQPFTSALRIEVGKKTQPSGAVQIVAPVDATVASGDVLMVSFWMRSATPE